METQESTITVKFKDSSRRRLLSLLHACNASIGPLSAILRQEIDKHPVLETVRALDNYRFLTRPAQEVRESLHRLADLPIGDKVIDELFTVLTSMECSLESYKALLEESEADAGNLEKTLHLLSNDAYQRILAKRTVVLQNAIWERLPYVPPNSIREAAPSYLDDVNALGESLLKVRALPTVFEIEDVSIISNAYNSKLASSYRLAVTEGKVISVVARPISIWDLDTGRLIHTLDVFCTCLAISGRMIIYGTQHTINIWDLEIGRQIPTPVEDAGLVCHLVVAEGKIIASLGKTIHMWDIDTGSHMRAFEGHTDSVFALAVADGKIISAEYEGVIRVWDTATGHLVRTHEGGVWRLAVTEGKIIVSDRPRMNVSIWDLATGRHMLKIDTCALSLAVADGKIITGSPRSDGINVWDLETGRHIQTLKGHTDHVYALAVAEGRIISGSEDKTIRIWDLNSGRQISTFEGHTGGIYHLAIADGKIVSGSSDQSIRIWHISRNLTNLTWEGVLNVFNPRMVTSMAEYAPSAAFTFNDDKKVQNIEKIIGDCSIPFCIEQSEYEKFMKDCRVLEQKAKQEAIRIEEERRESEEKVRSMHRAAGCCIICGEKLGFFEKIGNDRCKKHR